jgi:shikimate dehydrogenase
MKITGKTKLIGIFGDPVAHTLSPAMQNAAFESLGMDFVYVPFHVRPAELKAAVGAIRALGMPGVNITIPHKEKVIELLDGLDEDARAIGAVNTVVNREGKLTGYNTDGEGFLRSLTEETGFNSQGKKIIILGAGGAARGILASVLNKKSKKNKKNKKPERVIVANRTFERAEGLVKEFKEKFEGSNLEAIGLDEEALGSALEEADLLVNATSIGMEGGMEGGQGGYGSLSFIIDKLPDTAIVSDIVYKPIVTELIREADERGLTTHRGLGMLVGQGALSFELWTGEKAPVHVMRQAAFEALEFQ